jgi:putative transcriptional regulator
MTPIEFRALRQRLGLTQAAFAERYRLSRRTVEAWEAARHGLPQSAAILLTLIDQEPETIAKILDRAPL